MTLKIVTAACVLSASLILGCDDSNKSPAPTAAPAPSMGATNDAAKNAAADLKGQAADTQAAAANAMGDAKNNATEAGNTAVAQAQELYTKATTAIGNMKLEDAQKYVDQLKALHDKLPADWQAKIDDLAKSLTESKAKMSSVPNVPAMPK